MALIGGRGCDQFTASEKFGPKAAFLFWFFGDYRCNLPLFIVILVIYKYKNR